MNTANSDLLPKELIDSSNTAWRLSGEGVFSWSVFKLYRARLFVSGNKYTVEQAFVLELSYLRTLTAEQIVSTSMDELKRLRNPAPEVLSRWSDELMQIVPDVGLGDRLVGWFRPGIGVQFYSSAHLLGAMDDPVFAESFAAIWLDEQTRSQSLREALLAGTPGSDSTGA